MDIRLCCLLCRYKWGLAEGKLSHSCKIEVEHENGSTVLKQQPFETLDEVYTPVPFVSGHLQNDRMPAPASTCTYL